MESPQHHALPLSSRPGCEPGAFGDLQRGQMHSFQTTL